jgi:hypothetical protein
MNLATKLTRPQPEWTRGRIVFAQITPSFTRQERRLIIDLSNILDE